MVSLDNLKTAMAAIKTEINSYLKKADASSIYMTKDSANKSFATKSSVPKILGFKDADYPSNTHTIRSLKLPDSQEDYDVVLGAIKYGNYTQSNLCMAGYRDVQFAFSADTIDGVYASDSGTLDAGSKSLQELKRGESVTGVFATNEDSLARAKRAALSSTGKEFNTSRAMQGVIYHEVGVGGITFRLISTNKDSYQSLNERLYGIISNSYGLFYFISDNISGNTTVNIPFTITRLDGDQSDEYDCIINISYSSAAMSMGGVGASAYNALKAKLTSAVSSADTFVKALVDIVVSDDAGTKRYSQVVPSTIEYEESTQSIVLTYYGYGNTHDIYAKGWFKLTINSDGTAFLNAL